MRVMNKMNIENIQIKKIINEIMSKQLKSGVNPTDETVEYLFDEKTKDNILGMPITRFKKIKERVRSSSKEYNKLLDDIDFDLNVLFESISEQNKKMLNNFSIQEDEKIKLLAKIKSMQNRIAKLTTVSEQSNNFNYSLSENFSSFKNIDMDNTDAYINLEEKKAMLKISKKDLVKIPLSNASIKIKEISPQKNAYTSELSSLKNATDDYLNTFWGYKISYPKGDGFEKEVKVVLEIELDAQYLVSEVSLSPKTSGNMSARVYYEENNSWYEFLNNNNKLLNNKESWFIYPEAKKIKNIKIELSKSEPDFDDSELNYIFGLKNISVDYREYEPESTVKTSELMIDKNGKEATIQELSLEVIDFIPTDTDIKYYVQIKENNNFFKDYDFNDKSVWHADYFYEAGGVDGGSFCGNKSEEGIYQEVELVKGRTYTLSGYVKTPDSNNPVRIIRDGSDGILSFFEVESEGKWKHFIYTFDNTETGFQRITVKDSQSEGIEIQADKFYLVEGTEAEADEYSSPHIISPTNRDNPRYRQKIKLNNILTDDESFTKEELAEGETKNSKIFYNYPLLKNPIKREVKLYQGVKRWQVQSYQRPVSLKEQVGLYLWSNNKKVEFEKSEYSFRPEYFKFKKNYSPNISVGTGDNMHYLFSTWLYLKEPETINTRNLNYDICYNNEAVYINGTKLKKQVSGTEYSYNIQLKKGWNKLNLIIYLEDGTKSSYFQNIIDLSSFETWRSQKNRMKQVSKGSLYSGFDYEDDSVFAVSGNKIILNNQEEDNSNNFKVNYKYLVNSVESIKFIAELSSVNTYITPKIDLIKANINY